MPGDFLLSNGGLFVASVLVGLVVGALCLAALRRRPNPARNPTLNIVIASGGVLLGGGLFGGCAMFLGAGNPPVAAPLPCPGLNGTPAVGFSGGGCPTPTATGAAQIIIVTDVPRIQTLTPSVPPPPARTPVPSLPPNTVTPTPTLTLVVRPTQTIVLVTPSSTQAPTPRPLPGTFDITLVASGDAACNTRGFRAPYRVTIQGTSMTLLQVNANIATVGTYAPASGAFRTTKAGLPGTETYAGVILYAGGKVQVSGTYIYTNDPNVKCQTGPLPLFGETNMP
ncbi:MAG TPA: hypothetical protein PLG23_08795 [Thermoflexales bacterium]|nr:hypothetical protein [Thermoflexales bacterium]